MLNSALWWTFSGQSRTNRAQGGSGQTAPGTPLPWALADHQPSWRQQGKGRKDLAVSYICPAHASEDRGWERRVYCWPQDKGSLASLFSSHLLKV